MRNARHGVFGVISPAIAVAAAVVLATGCGQDVKAERLALQKQAVAIEARHMALDEEIAAWSAEVGRWIEENGVTVDPARLVLSLEARSYFRHEMQHGGGDPGYAHLEAGMKEIQAKRKALEADWLALLDSEAASVKRHGTTLTSKQDTLDFELGDPTVPIPGVSARARCCPLTAGGCWYTGEHCAPGPQKNTWHRVCEYECDPIILEFGPVLTAER